MPPINRDLLPITPSDSEINRDEADRDNVAIPQQEQSLAPLSPGEDPLEDANTNINTNITIGAEDATSFNQEQENQSAPGFIDQITSIAAPTPFDAAARARQLQEQQGIASLNDQLNIIDSDIADYDIRVRDTARQSRNRLAPQAIINRELAQIQSVSAEQRALLNNERQFLQNQITSRNNIVNSQVQFEQISYENALNQYNTKVNQYLQLAQLEASLLSQRREDERREVEFARAQAKYTMDIIVKAAQNGVSLDSIPQGLVDNLSQLSQIATGDPDYYANLANFIASNNLSVGSDGESANYTSILTVKKDDGTYAEVLLDRNTGNTITVNIPGTPVSGGSGGSVSDVIDPIPTGVKYENGPDGFKEQHIRNRDGTYDVYPTEIPNDAPDPKSPEREALRDTGVQAIPEWLDVSSVNDAVSFINSNDEYQDLFTSFYEGDRNQAKVLARELFGDWLVSSFYQGVIDEGGDLLYESPTEIAPLEFLTNRERNNVNTFLKRLVLENTTKYENGAELLDDMRDDPSYFRQLYANFVENGNVGTISGPTSRLPESTQSREQSASSFTDNGNTQTFTISSGREISVIPNVSRYRNLVSQYFPGLENDVLAIMNGESKPPGNPESLNIDGEYSVGLMQINLRFGDDGLGWQPEVRAAMGDADATIEEQRDWLFIPANNLRIARRIYDRANGSFKDWTVALELGLA